MNGKAGVAAVAGAVLLGWLLSAGPMASETAGTEAESKFEYTVIDGRADESVVMGYMVYTGSCMACHGPDGLGSAFAPSLVRAAERRSFEEFAQTVAEGRSIMPGQVMPSFADDARVMSHLVDIWNYLGARAEGALGRGRPQPLENGQPDDEPAQDEAVQDDAAEEGAADDDAAAGEAEGGEAEGEGGEDSEAAE